MIDTIPTIKKEHEVSVGTCFSPSFEKLWNCRSKLRNPCVVYSLNTKKPCVLFLHVFAYVGNEDNTSIATFTNQTLEQFFHPNFTYVNIA